MNAPAARILGPSDGKAGVLAAIGVRFMVGGEESGGGFSLVEHPMPPRALAAPLHRHSREDEYSFVLEGRVGAQLGEEVAYAEAGDLIFKPRDQWHTFWNAGDSPARILEIISPAGFEGYFEQLVDLPSDREPPDREQIAHTAARYGLELDFESIPGLLEAHGLRFGRASYVQHAPRNAMEEPGDIARFHDRCSDLMRELLGELAGAPDRPRTFPDVEDSLGWPRRRLASVLGGVAHLRNTEFGGRRPYRLQGERTSASGRWEIWMDAAQARAVRHAKYSRSMSEENVRKTGDFIAAYNRGDFDAAMRHFDPEIDWVLPPQQRSDSCRGPEAIRRFWQGLDETFEELRLDPQEFVDAGERVAVRLRFYGRGRGSGAELDTEMYHQVTTFQDGTMVRIEYFDAWGEALDAAGAPS